MPYVVRGRFQHGGRRYLPGERVPDDVIGQTSRGIVQSLVRARVLTWVESEPAATQALERAQSIRDAEAVRAEVREAQSIAAEASRLEQESERLLEMAQSAADQARAITERPAAATRRTRRKAR